MFCKNCGSPLLPGQAVCLKCGFKAGKGNTHCAYCGRPVNPGQAVCLNCGALIGKGNVGDLAGHSKTSMALFAIFPGSVGVHNFIMGEGKKGAMKIIFTALFGIGFIFAIIDFIKILSNAYVVDPEKAF